MCSIHELPAARPLPDNVKQALAALDLMAQSPQAMPGLACCHCMLPLADHTAPPHAAVPKPEACCVNRMGRQSWPWTHSNTAGWRMPPSRTCACCWCTLAPPAPLSRGSWSDIDSGGGARLCRPCHELLSLLEEGWQSTRRHLDT